MVKMAALQVILLFGSETWCLSPTALKQLEGFHVRAAWRMAHKHKPRQVPGTDTWQYPATEDVFEEVAMYSVEHYIGDRRDTIASFIQDRPISTPSAWSGEAPSSRTGNCCSCIQNDEGRAYRQNSQSPSPF